MTRLLIGVFLLALLCMPAQAEKRVALVIGNGAYEHVPELTNPRNDAEAVSTSLERLGFEVIKGNDLKRLEFEQKVREFGRAIRGADIALLYFAGHGLQVNGENYLVPTDTQLVDEADLDFEAIQLNTIMSQMEREPRTNLVFLDACRNNPLARNLARSMGTRSALVGRGLAPIETGIGTLITFATQPGNVALDGEGRNSPFTEAFIRHIETPDEDIAVILRRVRKEVIDNTDGKQVPWGNSSLTGSVVLNPLTDQIVRADDDNQSANVEVAYWNSIKDGTSPTYFENYLKKYPNGKFVDIAEIRISELRKARESSPQSGQTQIARLEQTYSQDPEPENPKQDRELVASIQRELNRAGCSVGTADGVWGNKTERGLKDFAGKSGVEITSLDPSAKLLEVLKGVQKKVCVFDLESLDGYWRVNVVTVPSSRCGWKDNSFLFQLKNGIVTGGAGMRKIEGTVSADGKLLVRRHFQFEGQELFNVWSGRIKAGEGSGIMQSQGACRGNLTITRL